MTYVDKSQINGSPLQVSAQESFRAAATRIFSVVFDHPLRVWRNSRDLHEVSGMSTEQLRDIGLTPSDVVAARCAPFHVGAGIMLAHLAERRKQSEDFPRNDAVVQPEACPRQTA